MTLTRKQIVVCFLIISFLTLAAYSSSLDNGFVNWDDPPYVIDNYSIRSLTPRSIISLFAKPQSSYYAPLVFLSYAIEYHFFMLNPYAYHLTNLALHILNSLLVFIFVYLIRQSRAPFDYAPFDSAQDLRQGLRKAPHYEGPPKAAVSGYERGKLFIPLFTAILFAIHPLHVESVAWITERKDVLSALFFLLSVVCYIKFTREIWFDYDSPKLHLKQRRKKRRRYYILSLLCFLAALLSKPMAVTLPLVLLLIDYYTRQNINDAKGINIRKTNGELKLAATRYRLIRNSILNKIPFFAFSIAFGFIALSLQKSAGTVRTAFYLDPLPHILTACRNFIFYPIKLLFPLKLSAYYPYPPVINFFLPSFFLSAILVITLFIIISRCRKNNPGFLFGLGFYFITILPTLQLIPIGNVIFADRFSYLPSIGIFYLIALVIYSPQRRPDLNSFAFKSGRLGGKKNILVAILVLSFSVLTFRRCPAWKDSLTLWRDTIRKDPSIPTAHLNLGEALLSEGRLDEAIEAFYQSKELDPNQTNVYSNLGDAYQKQGLLKKAEKEFITAIELDPEDPIVHNNLGLVYAKQGYPDRAKEEFLTAIALKADYAEPHNNLGLIFSQAEKYSHGIREFKKAIEINSLYRDAYHNLAKTLETKGDINQAIINYHRAIELRADFTPAYNDLGFAYAKVGRLRESIAVFEKAVGLDPESSLSYYGLALCYFFQGENNQAIQYRDRAIKLGYKEIPQELVELKYSEILWEKQKTGIILF